MWITNSLDPDAGKDRRQEEKRMTEDEMIGWHHRLSGHNLSKFWEMVKDREAWSVVVHGVTKSWKQLCNWTTTRFLFSALSWFPSPVLANLLKVFLKVTSFYVDQYYIKKMIRLYFYECSLCCRYRVYSLLFVISAAQMPIASDHLWLGWVPFIVVLPLQGLTISIVILCVLLMRESQHWMCRNFIFFINMKTKIGFLFLYLNKGYIVFHYATSQHTHTHTHPPHTHTPHTHTHTHTSYNRSGCSIWVLDAHCKPRVNLLYSL